MEEVVLLQGFGRDVDAQVPPINLEDEVEGQPGLEMAVEAEVGLTNLDDEVDNVGQLPLSLRRSPIPPPQGLHLNLEPMWKGLKYGLGKASLGRAGRIGVGGGTAARLGEGC